MVYYFNSFFLDEILPNAIVLTTDGPHHMSMHPGLMRQVDNYMEPNNLFPIYQNATEICKPYTDFLVLKPNKYT